MASFRFPLGTTYTVAQYTHQREDFALPVAARYPGATLHAVKFTTLSTTLPVLFPPMPNVARDLGPVSLVGGLAPRLFELSVIPFGARAALTACRGGCPTFYLATTAPIRVVAVTGPLLADGVVSGTIAPPMSLIEAPATSSPIHWLGVRFQDGLALDPWAWVSALLGAMAAAREPSDPDIAAWTALRTGGVPPGTLRLHEASGAPSTRALEASTDGGASWTTLADATNGRVLPVATVPVQLRLGGAPATARPVFSLYACDQPITTATSATAAADPAPATFTLPLSARGAVLQVIDLDEWFATRPPVSPAPFLGWTPLARYHLASHLQPVVDGNPALEGIVRDLRAAQVAGGAAHFTGLTVKDFPMIDGDATSAIIALSQALEASPAGLAPRFLIYKYLNISPAQWVAIHDLLGRVSFGVGMSIAGGTLVALTVPEIYQNVGVVGAIVLAAIGIVTGAIAAAIFGAISPDQVQSVVEQVLEPSLAAAQHLTAIWSRYPAALLDNPIAGDGDLYGLQEEIDHFGSWHQKLQLIRRAPDGGTVANQYIGWVGGVDVDPNRADDPGHRGTPVTAPGARPDWSLHPWHDVHARVTGAAVADLWKTWNERYEFELSVAGSTTLPTRAVNPPPEASITALADGPHVVQIGRTYFAPGPGRTGLPFAPAGEATTNAAMIKAILASQDYIYIEDQYFTPPGEAGMTDTFVGALIAAASTGNPGKKLIILVPSENDQPFGALRRRFLFSALEAVWGTRLVVGSPVRPPLLQTPGNYAHEGRAFLLEALAGGSTLKVGPRSRVPGAVPFWLWVEGEVMLCTGIGEQVTVDDIPGITLEVKRGDASGDDAPRTGATTRAHGKGAPVTTSQLKGIYVHAKVMIIDDVFVSIGTSNLNRRGMYHDGEITSFTIPRTLLAPGDNPARALRAALWAEHLGLAPEMGSALLGDASSAFALWRRAFFAGNRFTERSFFLTRPDIGAQLVGHADDGLKIAWQTTQVVLGLSLAIFEEAQLAELWRKVVDPTSALDPHPEATVVP